MQGQFVEAKSKVSRKKGLANCRNKLAIQLDMQRDKNNRAVVEKREIDNATIICEQPIYVIMQHFLFAKYQPNICMF